MHYDLRTEADAPAGVGHENWKDMSQRILNVMMPDTDVPIHKHSYAEDGTKISEHVLETSGECPGLQIPMGVYHTTRCLESGSVIFEAKDRPYDTVGTEEVWEGDTG